ncbi:GIY-YIG nuclease family protein [Flavobacterium sp. LAR06]|uniref:GIY-YIG nuclease family protein n=1 Tax=Flavobacterium sp. LAR06 TaxID=3064897 RepID=UPI0035C15FFF
MKSNQDRRKEIFKDSLPDAGSKEYFKIINDLEKKDNANIKEFVKESFKKTRNSFVAQLLSNCDLVTENTLRHFLNEFNYRAWNHGLRSMSQMFNIMEAFFIYRKPHIYFELIEEENYLISLFDFIDFITSKEFSNDKKLIEENLTNNLIFNFNIGKDLDLIKFSANGEEFIINGISIIRKDQEVTIVLNTGKKINERKIVDVEKFNFEGNPNKIELIKEFNKSLKNKQVETEFIDLEKKYAKFLVACRIDLVTETIDTRYVAEEFTHMFTIVTDDLDGFVDKNGNFRSSCEKEMHETNLTKLDDFNAIIEVAKMAMYIPYYLNINEDDIVEEIHQTEFFKESNSPIKKRKFKDTFGHKYPLKSLYILDKNNKLKPDQIKVRDDLFNVTTSGYWKKINIDEIGLDKKGEPIHGKTWVNQNLSWFHARRDDLIIKKEGKLFAGKNAGFIYILRNPIMGKDIFKIGLTRNNVSERADQLSKTSVPDKFYKSQEWQVKDCVQAESEIHKLLMGFRIDLRREFFHIQYNKAVEVIFQVVNQINKSVV